MQSLPLPSPAALTKDSPWEATGKALHSPSEPAGMELPGMGIPGCPALPLGWVGALLCPAPHFSSAKPIWATNLFKPRLWESFGIFWAWLSSLNAATNTSVLREYSSLHNESPGGWGMASALCFGQH